MKIGYFFMFLSFLCGASLSFAMESKEEGKLPESQVQQENREVKQEVSVTIFSAHLPTNQYSVQLTARNRCKNGTLFFNDADLAPVFDAWGRAQKAAWQVERKAWKKSKKEVWTQKNNDGVRKETFLEHNEKFLLCLGFFGGVCLGIGSAVAYYHTFLKK